MKELSRNVDNDIGRDGVRLLDSAVRQVNIDGIHGKPKPRDSHPCRVLEGNSERGKRTTSQLSWPLCFKLEELAIHRWSSASDSRPAD